MNHDVVGAFLPKHLTNIIGSTRDDMRMRRLVDDADGISQIDLYEPKFHVTSKSILYSF